MDIKIYAAGFLPIICFIIFDILNFIVYKRCKKFVQQSKVFVYNILCAGLLSDAGNIIAIALVVYDYLPNCGLEYILQTSLCLQMFCIVSIPIDKLLSLIFALRYQEHVTTFTLAFQTLLIWSTAVGITLCAAYLDVPLFIYVHITLLLVFLIVNCKIVMVVRKVQRQVVPLHHQSILTPNSAPTYKNIKITLPHLALYMYTAVTDLLQLEHVFVDSSVVPGLFLFSIFLMARIINPVFVIWRYKECRLQFRLLIARYRSTDYRQKINQERMEFYGVNTHPILEVKTISFSVAKEQLDGINFQGNKKALMPKNVYKKCRGNKGCRTFVKSLTQKPRAVERKRSLSSIDLDITQ